MKCFCGLENHIDGEDAEGKSRVDVIRGKAMRHKKKIMNIDCD